VIVHPLPTFLGIDAGTTVVKAAAVDAGGMLMAAAARRVPVVQDGPSAEIDPGAWVHATRDAVREVRASAPGPLAAVGVCSQIASLVLAGEDGLPLSPALSWLDQRADAFVVRATERLGMERVYRATGARAAGLAGRVALLRAFHPRIVERARWYLGVRDCLTLLLTGRAVTDPSMAGATGTLLLRERRRWEDGIAATELEPERLPFVDEPHSAAGRVTATGEALLGVPAGTPVAVGAADGACESLGMGTLAPGTSNLTLGTSGVLRVMTDRPALDPRCEFLCLPFLPDLWIPLAPTSNAGIALDWARTTLGFETHEELEAAALGASAGSEGVLFVPWLIGERFPFWNRRLRAGFHGLGPQHTIRHMARAVFEGIALNVALARDRMAAAGLDPPAIVLNGGAARSRLLARSVAATLRRPCVIASGGSLEGAAQLAAVAAGVYPDLRAANRAMTPPAVPIDGVEGSSILWEDAMARYARLVEIMASAQMERQS
jgi:sugar (pentulose or hexulose) kinase